MLRSKLERNIDIIMILASQGPMELTRLVHKTTISQSVLKQHLDFLIQQNFVEEQTLGKIFYAHTHERGLRMLDVIVPIARKH